MDLPAPVSPVSTARPRENSISSRSIRTMSRIERRASMGGEILVGWCPKLSSSPPLVCQALLAKTQFLEGLRNVRARVLGRFDAAGLYKIIGVLVPAAVRKIMPEHGGGGLRLADDADRPIGLGEPGQRLLDMARGLILGDHGLEAVDRGGVVVPFQIIAANVHFLAGELIA